MLTDTTMSLLLHNNNHTCNGTRWKMCSFITLSLIHIWLFPLSSNSMRFEKNLQKKYLGVAAYTFSIMHQHKNIIFWLDVNWLYSKSLLLLFPLDWIQVYQSPRRNIHTLASAFLSPLFAPYYRASLYVSLNISSSLSLSFKLHLLPCLTSPAAI